MRSILTVTVAVVLVGATAGRAFAQDVPRGRTAVDGIEVVTGLMDYDMSGTGQTIPIAIRGSKALSNRLALEFGATIAAPQQQFGPSRVVVPEAQLSYSWQLGRVRPFVSGGAGTAMIRSDVLDTRWRSTFSAGGGARVQLGHRVYAVGEMRLRAISRQFSSTTAEWLGGIGWRLN